MKELNPGLKALKQKDPKLVAKMLNKPVDEVKKMMKGGKVKMVLGGLLGDKMLKKVKNKMAYGGKVKMMGGGYMDDEKKKMAYGGKVKMKKGGYAKKKMGKCPRDGMAMKGKTKAKRSK